jgi:hypothetical protein
LKLTYGNTDLMNRQFLEPVEESDEQLVIVYSQQKKALVGPAQMSNQSASR